MPDLPSLEADLERFKLEVTQLKQSLQGTRARPHKLAMLLAVLDLADEGLLERNAIPFDEPLRQRFHKYFQQFSASNDSARGGAPFFHLRSSSFWRHRVKIGSEDGYARVKKYESAASLHPIEEAFLENWAFAVVSSAAHRDELRLFIMEILSDNKQKAAPTEERLGLSFHRGFPVYRSGLSQILELAASGTELSTKNIKAQTTLGTAQVEAFPRYAGRMGLLDDKGLTPFGVCVAEKDISLSQTSTKWALHYFISSPYRNAPNFWNYLVQTFFASSQPFGQEEVRAAAAEFAAQRGAKAPSLSTLDQTQTAFLGTYANSQSLGELEVFEPQGSKYLVGSPRPIAAGAFACVLADYWAARWGHAREALLSELAGGELAALLLLSSGEVNSLLRELSRLGLLDLERRTPPFQVIRRWDDAASLWPLWLFADAAR